MKYTKLVGASQFWRHSTVSSIDGPHEAPLDKILIEGYLLTASTGIELQLRRIDYDGFEFHYYRAAPAHKSNCLDCIDRQALPDLVSLVAPHVLGLVLLADDVRILLTPKSE